MRDRPKPREARVDDGLDPIYPPRPGAYIVRLWAWGGISRSHDFLMSDGTICTLHENEVPKYKSQQEPTQW